MRVTVRVDARLRPDAVRRAIREAATTIVAELPERGKVYAKRDVHVDTGELRDSITAEQRGELMSELRADAPHAEIEELRHPFLVPAALEATRDLPEIVQRLEF